MISRDLIEAIRNKTDIVAVISEFVKLRKTGKNFIGPALSIPRKNPRSPSRPTNSSSTASAAAKAAMSSLS